MNAVSTLNTVGKTYLAAVYAAIIVTSALANLVPVIKIGKEAKSSV